jgi:cell wall-associated NlpC family hydrolase
MTSRFVRSLALGLVATFAASCATVTTARPEAFPRSGGFRPAPLPPSSGPIVLPVSTGGGVLDTALLQRGVRYQLGGATPSQGFDCSGLVQFVFNQHGIALPRTAAEQWNTGLEINADAVTQGDLVFFSTTGPGPTHVGIVVDSGVFVHAPDTGRVVRVERFDTPYWSSRYLGARRVAE